MPDSNAEGRVESRPSNKRRFQIHLSTDAVILMIAAGGIVWANAHRRHEVEVVGTISRWTDVDITYDAFGWPILAYREQIKYTGKGTPPVSSHLKYYGPWSYPEAGFDVGFTLGSLWALWIVCEWWIRRRAARKMK